MATKLAWQYRGLGLPQGVALARPVSRRAQVPSQGSACVLLIGDGMATALAPALRRLLTERGVSLLGPAPRRPEGSTAPTHVVFAFDAAPAGAPVGWQAPLAAQHRGPGVRMLWVDVDRQPAFVGPEGRALASRAGMDVLRPSEQVLRRAPNGAASAAGMAGVAGLVATWAQQFRGPQKQA